jgi:hypothetical protein
MPNGETIVVPAPAPTTLRETPVDQTKRLPATAVRGAGFSPARLFADHAFAARIRFLVACGALGFCAIQGDGTIHARNLGAVGASADRE